MTVRGWLGVKDYSSKQSLNIIRRGTLEKKMTIILIFKLNH